MNIIKILVLTFISVSVMAGEPPSSAAAPVVKNILHEQLGAWPEGEVLVDTLDLPANFAFAEHYHPGDEIIYVLRGSGQVIYRDEPNVHLVAGDSARIAAGKIHSGSSGEDGLQAVIIRVHPTGEPIRIDVPAAP